MLQKHESEHFHTVPHRKIKVYNYHQKLMRPQIKEGVLINNAKGVEFLNSKSEITRGAKLWLEHDIKVQNRGLVPPP